MIAIAQRLSSITSSVTLVLSQRAEALRREGKPIINLTVGEPDFDTPQHIKDSAIAAINNGFTKYTAIDGIAQLKEAVINKFSRDNNLTYSAEQIIVSVGAKHSLFNAFAALLNEGDEVVIPAPYWTSYPEMVRVFGAVPVITAGSVDNNLKMTPAQLAAAITERTRLLILNSPNNPSGMCYTREELAEFAAILLKHPQIAVVSDDIYEHIVWGATDFCNIVNIEPRLYDRTVVINGVSKAYAMTGWRIGFAAGPPKVIAAMKTIQSQSTSNPTSIAQFAAAAALSGDQTCVSIMADAFKRRYELVFAKLQAMPGLICVPSHGAFYAFPDVSGLFNKQIENSWQLSEYLLQEAYVAVMPGEPFGMGQHLRISFATHEDNLMQAMQRMAAAFNKLMV